VLSDLSLYNNDITVIERLDSLVKLQCLSLGNNKIADIEQVWNTLAHGRCRSELRLAYLLQVSYLRRLPGLEVLNLDGNPFVRTKAETYQSFVLAILPRLKYLDYCLVVQADVSGDVRHVRTNTHCENTFGSLQVKAARDSGVLSSELLTTLALKDEERKRQQIADAQKASEQAKLSAANMDVPQQLFADTYEDPDFTRFKSMPGFKDSFATFLQEYTLAENEFTTQGMHKHQRLMVWT
jgi:hypothetical protein